MNGKTRSKVVVGRGSGEAEVVAAVGRDATSQRFLDGRDVRKVIYVPNRLVNFVVG